MIFFIRKGDFECSERFVGHCAQSYGLLETKAKSEL